MPRLTTRLRYGLARLLVGAKAAGAYAIVPSWVVTSILDPTFRSLTRDAYQKSSAFFACVSSLAFAFPEPPLYVYDDEGDLGQPLPRHALRKLLRRPMPTMGEAEMLATTIVYLAVGGNAYWHKIRGQGGRVVQLKPYHAGQIMAVPGGPSWVKYYEYDQLGAGGQGSVMGTLPRIDPKDIVHFKWPSVDPSQPWQSQPPILAAASEVDSDVEMVRYAYALLKNDAIPRTTLSIPADRPLLDGEYERIRDQWNERHGAGNRGGIAILEAGATAQRLSLNMQEMAFEAMAKLPESRIAAALRVPPIIAGLNVGLDRSTYSNYGEARKAFAQDTLATLWRLVSSEITADLLPEFDGLGGVEVRFDLSRVAALQEDATQKYNRTINAWKGGLLTKNEGRRALGYKDAAEGGDEYFKAGGGGGFGQPAQPAQPAQLEDQTAPKAYVLLGDGSVFELPSGAARIIEKGSARLSSEQAAPQGKKAEGDDLAAFEGQVERAMNRYLRAEYRKAAEGVRNGAKAGEIDPDIVEQLGLDLGGGVKRIMKRIYPKVLERAFGDAEFALDLDIAFDVQNKEVQSVLGELADLVTRVSETTRESIRSLVGKGAAEGWSIDRLAEEILASGAVVSKSRAKMIGRTETATAYSMGSLLAYAFSKVVDRVEWLATIDATTCEQCKALNGETRPLEDATFSDGSAHPPRHPNCRCAIAPIVSKG